MRKLAVIVLAVACAPLWAQAREPECNKRTVQTQCSPLDGGSTVRNPNDGQKAE